MKRRTSKILTTAFMIMAALTLLVPVTPVKSQEPVKVDCDLVRALCQVAYDADYGVCRATGGGVLECYFWADNKYKQCVWNGGCVLFD